MGIRAEDTPSGKKRLRDSETGEFAGFLTLDGKLVPTSVANLQKLKEEVEDAQSMAAESNQPEAYDYYYKKQTQYEELYLLMSNPPQ